MSFLIQAVYSLIAQFPGLAARTHRPCGRMGRRLRAAMGSLGTLSVVCGAVAGSGGVRGWMEGSFGYFPAILLGFVAAFLLASGTTAIARAVRNPAPPTAANVVPFCRSIESARAQVHGPGFLKVHRHDD